MIHCTFILLMLSILLSLFFPSLLSPSCWIAMNFRMDVVFSLVSLCGIRPCVSWRHIIWALFSSCFFSLVIIVKLCICMPTQYFLHYFTCYYYFYLFSSFSSLFDTCYSILVCNFTVISSCFLCYCICISSNIVCFFILMWQQISTFCLTLIPVVGTFCIVLPLVYCIPIHVNYVDYKFAFLAVEK